jgi:hypothetical protein
MSLNAGAGAGSSCPDVAVERRLRVPTLFWSTVQNAIPIERSCVRVHAVVCPPAGRQALLSVAPASFVRTAVTFSIQHTIEILALSERSRAPRDPDRHRAAGYTGRWPKPRTQAGPSAVGAARSGGAPARDGSGRGADPSYPDSAAEQPSTHDGPRHRRKSLGLGS